jgi:hypothetical protein
MKTLAICFLVLYAAMPAQLLAQATDCNDPSASPEANAMSQQQWENQSSPVYADATELARTLDERGVLVQCMRRSLEERLFKGQKGAAWFKTDRGIFEVLISAQTVPEAWWKQKGSSEEVVHAANDTFWTLIAGQRQKGDVCQGRVDLPTTRQGQQNDPRS